MRVCRRGGVFDFEILERLPGLAVLRVCGKDAHITFADEPGVHQFQRFPINDKQDRIQTSAITVAVLPEPSETEIRINERDLEIKTCRAGSAGGQNVNKVESAVIVKHIPTGLAVRCETERSQLQNKQNALALLRARLQQAAKDASAGTRSDDRRSQIGRGVRAERRRIIRVPSDDVRDLLTGQRWTFKAYSRGDW